MAGFENWSIKVKVDISDHKVIWPLVLLSILRARGMSEKILFIICVLWVIALVLRSMKFTVPRVNGLWLYMAFITISAFIGLSINDSRSVQRDLYYYLPTVVSIILGYYLAYYKGKKKSIIRTICLCGSAISAVNFINASANVLAFTDFDAMKTAFSVCIYEVNVALAILIYVKFICKKHIFSKYSDWILMLLMMGQIILCLSRAAIIQLGVEIVCIIIFAIIIDKNNRQNIKSVLYLATSVIAICIVVVSAMPNDVTDQLLEKFSKTADEINSEQIFDDQDEAIENWRAYEIQEAVFQWKENNIFNQLFGDGMGKGVDVNYVPYTWARYNMIENDEIPLLHNGYYTSLNKGGVLGFVAIIWLFVSNILEFFKQRKKREIDGELIHMLAVTSIITLGIVFTTYVVRGPVSQVVCMFWGLMIGWTNKEVRAKWIVER